MLFRSDSALESMSGDGGGGISLRDCVEEEIRWQNTFAVNINLKWLQKFYEGIVSGWSINAGRANRTYTILVLFLPVTLYR